MFLQSSSFCSQTLAPPNKHIVIALQIVVSQASGWATAGDSYHKFGRGHPVVLCIYKILIVYTVYTAEVVFDCIY